MKKKGIGIHGHRGTWYVIASTYYNDEVVFLLEHETFGEDSAHLIVNGNLDIILEDVYNGFDDLNDL
jgi:hypothetical protein